MTSERKVSPVWERTVLLLQGGGALGSYHHGVYQALVEAGYRFDWFAGTSIGALQSAIIAGNAPDDRLAALDAFWERITWPQFFPAPPPEDPARKAINLASAMGTMVWGQPGFFQPAPQATLPWPWNPSGLPAHYDLSPLEKTLTDLIDFDRLNHGGPRVSLGAVEVETGRHVYFDNREQAIDVRHVLASGALPPAFPPVAIDGFTYWDGGLLSNTPLDVVLDEYPRHNNLCFMVDLFDPRGDTPTDMDSLEDRRKDIIYASRSHTQIEDHSRMHELRRAVNTLYQHLPEAAKADPALRELGALGCTTSMNLVHFVYGGQPYRSWAKDFIFLPQTIADHRHRGYQDAAAALAERYWERPVPVEAGIIHHEVNKDRRGDGMGITERVGEAPQALSGG